MVQLPVTFACHAPDVILERTVNGDIKHDAGTMGRFDFPVIVRLKGVH
jgi:hypothetical protein